MEDIFFTTTCMMLSLSEKKWYKFFTHKFITQLGSTNRRYTFLVDFYEKKLSRELQHIIERKKNSKRKKIIALAPRNGKNRN